MIKIRSFRLSNLRISTKMLSTCPPILVGPLTWSFLRSNGTIKHWLILGLAISSLSSLINASEQLTVARICKSSLLAASARADCVSARAVSAAKAVRSFATSPIYDMAHVYYIWPKRSIKTTKKHRLSCLRRPLCPAWIAQSMPSRR